MKGVVYKDDIQYARSRLEGVICTINKTPIRVLRIEGNGDTTVESLATSKRRIVKLSDIDVTPPRIGYVNHPRGVSYICRVPLRDDWRQGIRDKSSQSLAGESLGHIPTRCLYEALKGRYPTFEEVVAKGFGAWSKDWALQQMQKENIFKIRGSRVCFRSLPVGHCSDGTVKLDHDYKYLEESLHESL